MSTSARIPSAEPTARSTLARLRDIARFVRREIGVAELRSGRWFHHLMLAYLEHHEVRHRALSEEFSSREQRRRRIRRTILGASAEAALIGGTAAALTTEANVLTTESSGALAVVAVPMAGAAVVGDLLVRTLVQMRMAFDLADLRGTTFASAKPEQLVRLYSLAYRTEQQSDDPDDLGADLVDRLVRVEAESASDAIGSRLSTGGVLRNVIPFVNVVTSTTASWHVTRQMGEFIDEYLVWWNAFEPVLERVEASPDHLYDVIVEGIWHMFVADAQLGRKEAAVLSALVDRRPRKGAGLMCRFVDDETAWLERLAQARAPEQRALIMEALEVAAAVDAEVPRSERLLLERAAATLGQPFDEARVERLRQQFIDGAVGPTSESVH